MPKFLFTFHHGPQFKRPSDGPAYQRKWRQWTESLGNVIVDPGVPVGPSKTVSAQGVSDGGSNPVAGIMTIETDGMTTACDFARSCPHVELGGTLEVAETMNMKM